jgi:hypothetical protein
MRGSFDITLRKDALSPMWTLKIETGGDTHIFKLYNSDVKEIAAAIPKEVLTCPEGTVWDNDAKLCVPRTPENDRGARQTNG